MTKKQIDLFGKEISFNKTKKVIKEEYFKPQKSYEGFILKTSLERYTWLQNNIHCSIKLDREAIQELKNIVFKVLQDILHKHDFVEITNDFHEILKKRLIEKVKNSNIPFGPYFIKKMVLPEFPEFKNFPTRAMFVWNPLNSWIDVPLLLGVYTMEPIWNWEQGKVNELDHFRIEFLYRKEIPCNSCGKVLTIDGARIAEDDEIYCFDCVSGCESCGGIYKNEDMNKELRLTCRFCADASREDYERYYGKKAPY